MNRFNLNLGSASARLHILVICKFKLFHRIEFGGACWNSSELMILYVSKLTKKWAQAWWYGYIIIFSKDTLEYFAFN